VPAPRRYGAGTGSGKCDADGNYARCAAASGGRS